MRIYTCYSHVEANDKRCYSCYPCYPGLVAHPSNSRTSCTQKRCKRGLNLLIYKWYIYIYWLLGSEKVCFHKKKHRKFHWVVHVQLWHCPSSQKPRKPVVRHLAAWKISVMSHSEGAEIAGLLCRLNLECKVLRIAYCALQDLRRISSDSMRSLLMLNMSVSQNYPVHSSTSFNII